GGVGVADDGGDLEGGEGLEGLAARDGEGAALVGSGDATCSLGDVAADGFCGAQARVPELGVADACGLEGDEQLDGDVEGGEPMMRELERAGRSGHARPLRQLP